MRVAVLAAQPVPFFYGGAQRLCASLAEWISAAGHDCTLVEVQSPERDLPTLLATYEECSTLDLGDHDVVISTKYPTWMVQHDHHVVYMIHPLRGLYDTYTVFGLPAIPDPRHPAVDQILDVVDRPPTRAVLPELFGVIHESIEHHGADDPVFALPGPLVRRVVRFLDRIGLHPDHVRAHWAISGTVAGRAGYFPPGVTARSAVPPSSLGGLHRGAAEHFFLPGRLDGPKRVDLVIDALRHVPFPIPLKIAGTGPLEGALREQAAGDPRIEFLGAVDDARLADLYADALAVPYVPLDEDLGLVALEAMGSGTPVVTCRDSGGVRELVLDGRTGLVVAPEAHALGAALSRLAGDPGLARRLGDKGVERSSAFTPEAVVGALLGSSTTPRPSGRRGRPRVVAPTTFPVYPALGGGQLRCLHLLRGLAEDFDVEIVSLSHFDEDAAELTLAPGLVETTVPKSRTHQLAETEVERDTGIPVTDVVAHRLMRLTPAFGRALAAALDGASCVLLEHPFLQPLTAALAPDLPVVYDAHNAEVVLKRPTLGRTPVGRLLLDDLRAVEGAAVRTARLVVACAEQDADRLAAEFGAFPRAIVSNGVSIEATPFVGPERRREASRRWLAEAQYVSGRLAATRHVAIFVGSWHPPNVDAVETIFGMARELPDVAFVVAGSIGGPFADRHEPGNVLVTGPISDESKRGLLAAADVALNPVMTGSGTNLKIVEYLAAGVPTVSTPIGVRGVGAEDGVHVTIAEPAGFPVAVRRVLDDRARAARTAAAGRRLAETRYDWSLLGAAFRDAVRDAVPELGASG